jgi:hypothetical protein
MLFNGLSRLYKVKNKNNLPSLVFVHSTLREDTGTSTRQKLFVVKGLSTFVNVTEYTNRPKHASTLMWASLPALLRQMLMGAN